MSAPNQTYVRLHRFHNAVAFDLDDTETMYINAKMARAFAVLLIACADDIETTVFSHSEFKSPRIDECGVTV